MRGPLRIESSTLARIGLVAMLAVAAALILHETRGTTLRVDEWVWVLDRRGHGLGTFLEPHNGHFSLVPLLLYKGPFATVGIDDSAPGARFLRSWHARLTSAAGGSACAV